MHTSPDRARLLAILALVISLHALVGWLLVMTTRLHTVGATTRGFEMVLISPPVSDSPVAAPPLVTPRYRDMPAGRARSSGARGEPTPAPAAQPPSLPIPGTRDAPPRNAPDASGHASIDWDQELMRTASNAVTEHEGLLPKDFGFPHAGAAPPARPGQFAWDHTHTHRVESIAEGGVLVNLNDNCVLVFVPLPFVICAPGKKPANGGLFEHMHDTTAAEASGGNP